MCVLSFYKFLFNVLKQIVSTVTSLKYTCVELGFGDISLKEKIKPCLHKATC